MNNEQMVSVPRAEIEAAAERFARAQIFDFSSKLRALLAQPAAQHQGEPVALPARRKETGDEEYDERNRPAIDAWNACLDEIAKLGPLYPHADANVRWKAVADEQMQVIARLREGIAKHWKVVCDQRAELDALRAQLAEQNALLREVLEAFQLEPDGSCINPGRDFIRPWAEKLSALSASAEPSALKCGNCGASTGQACNEKGCGYLEAGNGEPSAPVERDELAILVHAMTGEQLESFASQITGNPCKADPAQLYRVVVYAVLERKS